MAPFDRPYATFYIGRPL